MESELLRDVKPENEPYIADPFTELVVAVEGYEGIVQGIRLFENTEDAEKWFKEYTGCEYNEFYDNNEIYNEEYDQSNLFIIEIPEWLRRRMVFAEETQIHK